MTSSILLLKHENRREKHEPRDDTLESAVNLCNHEAAMDAGSALEQDRDSAEWVMVDVIPIEESRSEEMNPPPLNEARAARPPSFLQCA